MNIIDKLEETIKRHADDRILGMTVKEARDLVAAYRLMSVKADHIREHYENKK